MSELKEIEKILEEASSVGIRSKTIESAYNILNRNPDMDRVSAYNLAFNTLLSTTDEVDARDIVDKPIYVDNEDDDLDYSVDEVKLKFFEGIDDIDESLEEGIS
jgi:bisphosphoglycerate-independent phosphoglycerate mutase (AlkP superfamily)